MGGCFSFLKFSPIHFCVSILCLLSPLSNLHLPQTSSLSLSLLQFRSPRYASSLNAILRTLHSHHPTPLPLIFFQPTHASYSNPPIPFQSTLPKISPLSLQHSTTVSFQIHPILSFTITQPLPPTTFPFPSFSFCTHSPPPPPLPLSLLVLLTPPFSPFLRSPSHLFHSPHSNRPAYICHNRKLKRMSTLHILTRYINFGGQYRRGT